MIDNTNDDGIIKPGLFARKKEPSAAGQDVDIRPGLFAKKKEPIIEQDSALRPLTPETIENINKKSGSNFSTNPKDIERYNSFDLNISTAAAKKGEDPNLIKFLMMQESRMKPGQTSPAGYYGLAQTNKNTIKMVNANFGTNYKLSDMDDPEKAAEYMADYIKLAKKFGAETWDEIVVAYNRGIGHVKTHKEGGEHPEETQKYLQAAKAFKDSTEEQIKPGLFSQKQKDQPSLSFQGQQEVPIELFEENQAKYRVDPRLKNVAHATGVSEKIVAEVQKAMQQIPKRDGSSFKYDNISSRLNAFSEMFPELANEAEAVKQELLALKTGASLSIVEQKLDELESQVSGTAGLDQAKFRGYPGAESVLGAMRKKAQHPNWEKYSSEIINNPAAVATRNLMENTQKIRDILEMEAAKEGVMVSRYARGVAKGLGEETYSMLRLPQTLKDNKYINSVADKLRKLEENPDSDIKFSPDEEHLLRALSDNFMAHQALDPQRHTALNWGYATGRTIPFMIEMALTGGIGRAVEAGVKRSLTKGLMMKAASETISINMAARLASIGVQSSYMPRLYKNWAINVSNGQPAGQAFMDSWYENFNEVFSERIAVGKLVDLASPSIYQTALRNMGSALSGRGIKGIPRAILEEYLEEKYAEIGMYAYRPGDFKEFFNEFTSLKSNVFTFGSVASMTGFLSAPMIAQDATQSIVGKMALNRLKKVVPSDIRADFDMILDNKDLSVEQAYTLMFERINTAVQKNEIEGNIFDVVSNSLRYAVAKTQNVIWDNFSDEVRSNYTLNRENIRNIPAQFESEFIDILKKNGIEIPEGKTIYDLTENPAMFKPENARTPQEKEYVKSLTQSVDQLYKEKGEAMTNEAAKQSLKEQWELQGFIDFNKERITRIEDGIELAENRIEELNQKPEKTEAEVQELSDLGTFIAENKKILSEAVETNREFEKKLSDIKSQKPFAKPTGTEVVEEKSPKSETTPEQELPKSETLEAKIEETVPTEKEKETAKKAKISPKNFADLVRVGKELFGQNEVKANAAAVIMDRLIRNQAKRAGISVEEMYAKYEFQKVESKDLADIVSDPALKEQLKQGRVAASGAFIARDGKLIINALTNPNISTPLHEMAHAFEGYLSKAERNTVLKFAGATQWDRNASEIFAKGFEKYLSEGKAPSAEMGKIFDLFRGWLIDIYRGVTGSEIDIKLNAPMRKLYDSMLAEEQKQVKMPEGLSKRGEALFQIIGENANLQQTVRDNLAVAKEMEAAGESVEEIEIVTGWRKDKSGKWKYDINGEIVLALYNSGLSYKQISEEINVSPRTVGKIIINAGGIPRAFTPKGKDLDIDEAAKRYLDGESLRSIAEHYNVDGTTIMHRLKKAGIEMRPRYEAISKLGGKEKITEEDRASIKLLYENGATMVDISDMYGVDASTIFLNLKKAGVDIRGGAIDAIKTRINPKNWDVGLRKPFQSKKNNKWFVADSNFEFARMIELEEDASVLKYERSPDIIDYGGNQKYNPDLKITYTDGKVVTEEIKPDYIHSLAAKTQKRSDLDVLSYSDAIKDKIYSTKLKTDAAVIYFKNKGEEYKVVTDKNLSPLALKEAKEYTPFFSIKEEVGIRKTTLQKTEDVARDEQIILFQGGKQESAKKPARKLTVTKNIDAPISEFDVAKGEDGVSYFTREGAREEYRGKFGKHRITAEIELENPLPDNLSGFLPSDAETSGLFEDKAREAAKEVFPEVWGLSREGGVKVDNILHLDIDGSDLHIGKKKGGSDYIKDFVKTANEIDADRDLGMLDLIDKITTGTKESRGWNYDGEINPYEIIVFTNKAIKSVTDESGNKIKIRQDAKETRESTPESRKAEGAQRQEDERIRVRQPQKDRMETEKTEEGEVRFQTLPKTIEIDGVKRPTTNSKGQQIHPTEEGVRNFWKWFSGKPSNDLTGNQNNLLTAAFFESEPELANAIVSSLKSHSGNISYFRQSRAVVDHILKNIGVREKSVVFRSVLSIIRHNNEILDSIIEFIPVDVMDNLSRQKISPKMILHNESVLQDLLSVEADTPIPFAGDITNSLIRCVAFSTTESLSVLGFWTGNESSAIFAREGNSIPPASPVAKELFSIFFPVVVDLKFDTASRTINSDHNQLFNYVTKIGVQEEKTKLTKDEVVNNINKNTSKVVDDQGRPLVVYHGSPYGGIREFDRKSSKIVSSGLKEFGVFFTTNPKVAEVYRTGRKLSDEYKKQLDIERRRLEIELYKTRNNREWDAIEAEMGRIDEILAGKIYEAYLKIDNLHEFNAKAKTYPDSWQELSVDVGYKIARGIDAVEALKGENNAYKAPTVDGILAKNLLEVGKVVGKGDDYGFDTSYLGDTYLIFDGHPENIKSTENLGTFSPETGNILFQSQSGQDLFSKFPDQQNIADQKKQDRILKALQIKLDDSIRYISSIINNQPKNAVFIRYGDKTYSVSPVKIGKKEGLSVRLMEVKDTQGKGQVIKTGYIRDKVLEAYNDEKNRLSKDLALSMNIGYLVDEYTKKAQDSINKNIKKEKPGKREKPQSVPISSLEDLLNRIKIERNAVRDFQKLIREVYDMIKESNDKGFITAGQFLSITLKMSGIKNDFDRKIFIDYVDEVLGKAGYRKQYKDAKDFIAKLKSKLDKTGTAREFAEAVIGLNSQRLKQFTYEELMMFNEIASKVGVGSQNMKVWHIQRLSNLIDQKEFKEAEEKSPLTVDEIKKKIDEFKNKLKGIEVDPKTGEKREIPVVKDRKFITSALRELARLRNLAWQVYKDHNVKFAKDDKNKDKTIMDVDSVFKEILDELGVLDGMTISGGELESQLQEDKANYINSIIENLKATMPQIMTAIKKLPVEMKEPLLRLMAVTRNDLEKLNIAEVEAFDAVIMNLAHGHITPFAGVIEGTIGRNKLKEEVIDKFFANVSKSGRLDRWVEKHSNKAGLQARLQQEIWSKQSHRIDTWLHNFDKDHTIGSMYAYIGRGISKESVTVKKFDDIVLSAFEKFARHYSIGVKGERLHQTKSQREKMQEMLNWVGMILAEKSWRSMDTYNEQEADEFHVSLMHDNYVASTGEISSSSEIDLFRYNTEKLHYHSLMEFLRKNNATKTVNGVEIMDTEKAEALLREHAHVSKYMDAIKEAFDGMKGMAEWSTYANGRTFYSLDNYFPFFVKKHDQPIDISRVRESLYMGRRPGKMQASATYKRTGGANYVMINPNQAVKRYIREVAKNYHVYGEVKKVLGAIIEAGNDAKKKDIAQGKVSNADRLTKAIVTDIKLRLDKIYGVNSFTPEKNSLNKLLKATKLGLLPKLHRIPSEFISNTERALMSIWNVPIDIISHAYDNEEAYKYLIQDYIGEKYMSRWGDEVKGKLFENRYMQLFENTAKWMVTYADTKVGRPLFVYEMRNQFKKLSGREFDPKKFMEDLQYRVDNESYIERSATRAVRKVEELFNEKSPMTAPTFIKFGYGLMKPKKVDSTFSKIFGFLMSFQRNEVNQVADSLRRIRYSSEKGDIQQGVADIAAIISSNALYGTLRTMIMSFIDSAYKMLFEALTGDEREDEYLQSRIESFNTWKFYQDKLSSSLLELGLGGNAALTLWMYKGLMFALEKSEAKPEEVAKVKEFMTNEFYVKHIPSKDYGTFNVVQKAFVSGLPIPTPLTEDLFRAVDDVGDMVSFMDTVIGLGAFEKEVSSKDARDALIWSVLTLMKYRMPSAFVPNIQQAFERDLRRRHNEERKKKGPSIDKESQEFIKSMRSPEAESFINAYDNIGKEFFDKETEEFKKMQKNLGR